MLAYGSLEPGLCSGEGSTLSGRWGAELAGKLVGTVQGEHGTDEAASTGGDGAPGGVSGHLSDS